MKINTSSLLTLFAALAATLLAAPVLADDTEIFSAASGGTIGPNIMFIIDTSGSMGTQVTTQTPYDPNGTYPVDSNAATNNGYNCSTAFDETAVYFAQGSSGNLPSCNSNSKQPLSYFNCTSGVAALGTSGYVTDAIVQWKRISKRVKGVTTYTYAWTPTLQGSTSTTQTYLACKGDYPGPGPFPTTATDIIGSLTSPDYTNTPSLIYWSNGASTQTQYTMYTGKYLNYAYYVTTTVIGTRISVVQSAATSLINSLSNVNIGLMRYSDNSNNSSPCINQGSLASEDCIAQGGMVVAPIAPIATARTSLLASLNSYQAGGYTPLSETMFEAYKYFSGGSVVFGNTSYDGNGAFPSVAASRVGNTLSSNTYLTPVQYSCQKNFVVYLTDGLPTEDNQADTLITGLPNEATLGGPCDDTTLPPYSNLAGGWGPTQTAGKCLSALTKYMFNTDMNPGMAGQQNVQTYFIGFGNDPGLAQAFGYLQSAATKGGGQAYSAGDLTTLQTALTSIVSNILQISTTFTAPTVAVNAFNRTQTLNDLYVSVFQPATTYHWPGNIKRYLLQNGVIVDANGLPAVDASSGFFLSSAKSFWSSAADGATISAGGAANQIPFWNLTSTPHRNVFTYIGANPGSPVDLTSSTNYAMDTTNPLLTTTLLNVTTAANLTNVINFIRGEDVRDANGNGIINENRFVMGDPLHAQPAVVIYGGTTGAPDPTDGVIYGAENGGMLHAISSVSGQELWAFVPQDVLPDLRLSYINAPAATKMYELDGSVRVIKYDSNGDGVVDPAAGDRVIIYVGQGRGGSNYYAVDVTDRNHPKFMWQIGASQLPAIGQAWSNPVIAKVNVAGGGQTSVQKLVLIFAAGYDLAEETPAYAGPITPGADTVGMGLYMVDAVSGTLLWSAGAIGSGANLQLVRMDHAITADVAVLDTNGDGYADRMYVGDLAGQLWRFDITNGNAPASLVAGGVIASLGAHDLTTPTLADSRRFYNTPDVASVQKKGQATFMNVAIGSGYRGHPLNIGTQDRMYAVRDYLPFTAMTQAQYIALTPIKDSDLTDITASVTPTLPANAVGWKLLLNQPGNSWLGEKVLSPASTFNNDILFTTYTPNQSSGAASCQPTLGLNRFYAISVIDGSPVANLNNLSNASITDRSTNLAQGGIAPQLAFLFPAPTTTKDANGNVIPGNTQSPVMCMSGVEVLGVCRNFQSRLKTYWNEADAP